MRIIKASNVGHIDAKGTKHAVYSCDIQVRSKRLATGGGDCTVKIWQAEEIVCSDPLLLSPDANMEKELLEKFHLATLAVHEGSVNVVRWSLDGQYLASGSDDTTILIYKLTNTGTNVGSNFGKIGNQLKNKEPWQRCYTLRGHSSDVMDIDWSSKGLLASGSIDNKVFIWSITNQSTTSTIISPIKVLDIHKSYVKGVAFDPLSSYLATCSSDNTVNIWDCNSWDVVKSFTEPLKDTKDLTLFRRLSWSPDGQCMCITGATKSKKQIGYVVKRNSWIPYVDLVGHDAPLLSGRFCPEMFVDNISTEQSSPILCIAVGDQKGVLSIWNTRNKLPLVVLRDAVINDITDIAWLVRNQSVSLVYTSLDGSIVFLDFGDELGVPMSEYMAESHFKSVYGRSKTDMTVEPEVLVEDPLALQYSSMHRGIQPSIISPAVSSAASVPRPVNILTSQVRSKTADGKKRITPMLVQPQGVATDSISTAIPVETMAGMKRSIGNVQESLPQPSSSSNSSNANVKVLRIAFNKEDIVSSVPISTTKSNEMQCFVKANHINTGQNTDFTAQIPKFRIKSSRLVRAPSAGGAHGNSYLGITSVSTISLHKITPDDSETDANQATSKSLWVSSVAGDTLSICAIKETVNSKRSRNSIGGTSQPTIADSTLDGLCVIGCVDGSLHILSLATGMLLCPPLILGAPVTHVDIIETFPVINGPTVLRILALSAYGNMWAWDVVNGQLQLHCKDTIHAALVSMKCRNSTTAKGGAGADNVETNVDSFGFNEVGIPMLYVKSHGALGGDWQAFVYYKEAGVWSRVADLRHIMSRLFNISINSQFQHVDATTISDISMLEGRICRNSGVTVEDILKVASSRVNAPGDPANDSATWSNMVTLMHCENRLALAFDMAAGPNDSQAKKWLAEWAYLCCCCGVDNRVAWVSNVLLSNISKQRNVSNEEGSPPNIGWHWLYTDHHNSLHLLRTIILPAIANSKRCTSLFTDINDSINILVGM